MHAPDLPIDPNHPWDPRYELKAVSLLSLGFGLVGLDRFIINPLFPMMAKDLGLTYQDLGLISAVLALTWGLASIFTGRLSDRIGRKKVLVPAVVVFSILVACSGLASGLISLLVIRGMMGLAEGAYVPASIVATVEASKPSRMGMNVGLQQMAAPLVGLGFGPVIAVAMLKIVPSWHWIFGIVALPGLVLAYGFAKVLRDTPAAPPAASRVSSSTAQGHWYDALRYRNVVFNTLGMFCYLTCLIVLSAFMPNYLTDYLKLDLDQMGMVLAGLGLGSCIGMVLVPALSDRWGRKIVILVALATELVALWLLMGVGAKPGALFGLLFVATFMNAGVVAITVGPLTSGAVPRQLATTATGIVIGLGEVVGGALAPAVAGGLAQQLGIQVILQICLGAVAMGLVIAALGVKELKATGQSAQLV